MTSWSNPAGIGLTVPSAPPPYGVVMHELSPIACRVLGSLLEKELTVAASYPLTMNALVSACNQTTGRHPVMTLDDDAVATGIGELREAGLARLVHASHGARSVKYRQAAVEALALDPPRRAVLTVLLLRGPQTPGELRSRSDRLHPFASVDEVDRTLAYLAELDDPLVTQLARRPGQKEDRWGHLLAGPPTAADDGESPAGAGMPPGLAPLAAFVGTWAGRGEGRYPTIDDFAYTEQIEVTPVPGKFMLAYRSATRAVDDGRTLHGESGFLRLVDDGLVELVVAQGSGLVEIAEGLVETVGDDGVEVALTSTTVAGTSTAKSVTGTERRYRVVGNVLTYEMSMAAVGRPLLPHLTARLNRVR
jgi:uncharacterized protein YceH (UPF0502 family)